MSECRGLGQLSVADSSEASAPGWLCLILPCPSHGSLGSGCTLSACPRAHLRVQALGSVPHRLGSDVNF